MSNTATLSLDGPWSFTTDPHDCGELEAWYDRRSGFGRQVEVPSAWQLYGRDLQDYTGAAWYYRTCDLPASWAGKQVRLCFNASDYHTRAWLNGELVGDHQGGYTPFAFDLTAHARPGEENHLVVRVYDPRDNSEIPHGEQGRSFTRVSGIWQPLHLEARANVFISHLTPNPALSPDRVKAVVELNRPDAVLVRLSVQDHTGAEVATTECQAENGVATGEVKIENARRWSPDDPYLYTLTATVLDDDGDSVSLCVGLREVWAIDGRLYLNGKPLILRGAVAQGYWPETLYQAPSDEAIQRELRLAKEAGINVLRIHGKIEDPRFLDQCDRLGMLVWAEVPSCTRWTPSARSRFRADAHAMLRRDAFRPSIIAWSLYYENRGLEEAGDELHPWLRIMHDEVAAADPTRPICTHAGGSSMRTDLLDEHRRYVMPEQAREWEAALAGELPPAGAPRFVSEFGLWGLPAGQEQESELRFWRDANWLAHANEAKSPRTAELNFERYKLAAVFEDLDNLSKLTQRRLMRGTKAFIELMRRNAAFAGYVGRSFADTEWEANGWLTYEREPKLGFDEWAAFNGPITAFVALPRHNYWSGETVEATFYVSNHTKNPIEGTLHWGVEGADCDGEVEVKVAAFETKAVGTVSFEAPAFSRPQAARLSMRLSSSGWDLNTNYEELTFSQPAFGRAEGQRVVVKHISESLVERLTAQGFVVETDWEPGLPIVAGSLEADVRQALDKGAHVVFLAESGVQTPNKGYLSFRALPQRDHWDRTASIHYIQWDLFPQLPLNTIMGWEMEDLFPQYVIPMSAFGEGTQRVMSNQSDEDAANVLAGYFEGWLGNFAASLLLQAAGHGMLLTTTLRLGTQYGTHPIATLLLNRLLTQSHLFEPRTVYQLET